LQPKKSGKMAYQQASQLLKQFAVRHRLLLALAFMAGLVAGFSALLIPLSIGKYYALALDTGSPRGKIFDMLPFEIQSLTAFFIFFSLVILMYGSATFVARQYADEAAEIFVKELREKLFARQIRQPLEKFRKPVGRYLLRYSGDMGAIKRLLSRGCIGLVHDLILLLLGIALLMYLNLSLSMLILGLTVVFTLIFWFFNRMLLPGVNRLRSIRSSNLAFVSSRLQALMTIKLTGRESQEGRKFSRRSEKLFQQARHMLWRENLQRAMIPFLMYCLLLAVLYFGSVLLRQQNPELDGASLLVFIMFLITIIPAFRRILYAKRHWRDGWLSLGKVIKALQRDDDYSGQQKLEGTDFVIEVHPFSVDFAQGKPLHFPRLSFQTGSINLLKGTSGSGKTMLLRMLAGLQRPPEASIFINGQDLRELSPDSLIKQVSLFTSEAPLLGNTIAGVLGNPRGETARQARHLLRHFDMNTSDEESLKVDIGQGGNRLSSGEVHILKLVRTLMAPRPILLLDDPFSGLEAHNVPRLAALLEALKPAHTILISCRQGEHIPPGIYTNCTEITEGSASFAYTNY
jgi:ABC-type multidrug transport system fused ATPase/permease subunit